MVLVWFLCEATKLWKVWISAIAGAYAIILWCCISVARQRFLSRNAKVAAVFAAQLHRWRRLTGFDERQKEQTHNDVSCEGCGSFALAGYQKIHLQKHRLNCPDTKILRGEISKDFEISFESRRKRKRFTHLLQTAGRFAAGEDFFEPSILPAL